MNRSLEALAIFTICLGGILAAVRISTQEARPASRNVAERSKAEAAPAKTSGSATEHEKDDCELAYEAGCGLDRAERIVYAPLAPLLSPEQFARQAIRSAPVPLYVLPDAETLVDYEQSRTGYDEVYDAAVFVASPADEPLASAEIEADYAAAELAAAAEAMPSPTWHLLQNGLLSLRADIATASNFVHASYVEPLSRGVRNRWNQSQLPRLLGHPRARAQERAERLLRQRAESAAGMAVTWEDYLAFAERNLNDRDQQPAEQVARQKSSRLWPR